MAKGTSFAEKAKRGKKKEKEFTVVKYVKSIVSEKSGHYRFQESMLKVPSDKSLDAYLKELEAGPVVEVEEVPDAQEESTADSLEPETDLIQSEEGGPSAEPTGEEVEEEVSESESTETSDNKDVAEEEAAESEDVDGEASEPVDEPKDEEPETTEDEPVEESDQDDVPSEETADVEDADPEEEVSEEFSEKKSD